MAYTKTTWIDRVVEFANRFAKTNETSTSVTLMADPGTVTEAGSPLSATRMNNVETQYDEAKTELAKIDGTSDIQLHGSNLVNGSVTAAKVAADVATQVELDAHEADTTAQDVAGTGTAITITLQAFTAYTDNYLLTFIAGTSNGGAATTININGLGAKSVYKPNTTSAPKFVAGKAYTVWYDAVGGNFFWKASAEGTAVAGDVLAPKTFSNDDDSGITGTMVDRTTGDYGTDGTTVSNNDLFLSIPDSAFYGDGARIFANDPDWISSNIKNGIDIFGKVGSVIEATGNAVEADVLISKTFSKAGSAGLTGTMPDRGTVNITPSTVNQAIASGKHSGSGVVYGDADLVAGNIKKDVNIFGKVGTLISLASILAGSVHLYNEIKSTSFAGSTYAKVREIQVKYAGTYRIVFEVLNDCEGRIYKNGTAVGTERINTSGSTQTYTQDFTFAAGDLVQLYTKRAVGGLASGNALFAAHTNTVFYQVNL